MPAYPLDADEARTETEYEVAMLLMERRYVVGFDAIGPLTAEQTATEQAYEAYQQEEYEEHLAQERAGGRQICPACNQRSLTNRTVCTYGRPGVEGSDYSALYRCERTECGYTDLAG